MESKTQKILCTNRRKEKTEKCQEWKMRGNMAATTCHGTLNKMALN